MVGGLRAAWIRSKTNATLDDWPYTRVLGDVVFPQTRQVAKPAVSEYGSLSWRETNPKARLTNEARYNTIFPKFIDFNSRSKKENPAIYVASAGNLKRQKQNAIHPFPFPKLHHQTDYAAIITKLSACSCPSMPISIYRRVSHLSHSIALEAPQTMQNLQQ